MKQKSNQNSMPNIPAAMGGVLEKVKNVKLPKVERTPKQPKPIKPVIPQKTTVAERLETASYLQPLMPEDTFPYFLLSKISTDIDAATHPELSEYIDVLHKIEIEQFSYCCNLNIAAEIQSGHFLLTAIKQLFCKEILFGKRHPSLEADVKKTIDAINGLLKSESKKDMVDKETTFTILYDCLLVAQNSFSVQEGEEPIQFHTTKIDVPFIFKSIEDKMSPNGTLRKKYHVIKEHISIDQKLIPNRYAKIISDYHALIYTRAASNFAHDCIKGLGFLWT